MSKSNEAKAKETFRDGSAWDKSPVLNHDIKHLGKTPLQIERENLERVHPEEGVKFMDGSTPAPFGRSVLNVFPLLEALIAADAHIESTHRLHGTGLGDSEGRKAVIAEWKQVVS